MEERSAYATHMLLEQSMPERIPPAQEIPGGPSEIILTREKLSTWTWIVSKGIANALFGLSRMVGHEIETTSLDLKWLPAKEVVNLLGGPEATGVGIYLTIEGDATGHLLLLHDTRIALQLIDMQLGLAQGTTKRIDEMERSVLGEMGNITGSFFLNALADTTDLLLMPSPPAVIVDMIGQS
jgi:chemotaxis protein CheC